VISERKIVSFRKNIVVSLLVMAILTEGCSSASHSKLTEPSYEGKRLSDWLQDFDNFNLAPEQRAMAVEAVRHMGSATVPFLVDRLSEEQLKEMKLEAKKWQERQAAAFRIDLPPNPRREALAALDALGPAAVNALPVLERLLNDEPPRYTGSLYCSANWSGRRAAAHQFFNQQKQTGADASTNLSEHDDFSFGCALSINFYRSRCAFF
jgi:hypothetical protein